jgi:hypothetical protein
VLRFSVVLHEIGTIPTTQRTPFRQNDIDTTQEQGPGLQESLVTMDAGLYGMAIIIYAAIPIEPGQLQAGQQNSSGKPCLDAHPLEQADDIPDGGGGNHDHSIRQNGLQFRSKDYISLTKSITRHILATVTKGIDIDPVLPAEKKNVSSNDARPGNHDRPSSLPQTSKNPLFFKHWSSSR